jgi:hypothetical protein
MVVVDVTILVKMEVLIKASFNNEKAHNILL